MPFPGVAAWQLLKFVFFSALLEPLFQSLINLIRGLAFKIGELRKGRVVLMTRFCFARLQFPHSRHFEVIFRGGGGLLARLRIEARHRIGNASVKTGHEIEGQAGRCRIGKASRILPSLPARSSQLISYRQYLRRIAITPRRADQGYKIIHCGGSAISLDSHFVAVRRFLIRCEAIGRRRRQLRQNLAQRVEFSEGRVHMRLEPLEDRFAWHAGTRM